MVDLLFFRYFFPFLQSGPKCKPASTPLNMQTSEFASVCSTAASCGVVG